jgi:hypothetical protein
MFCSSCGTGFQVPRCDTYRIYERLVLKINEAEIEFAVKETERTGTALFHLYKRKQCSLNTSLTKSLYRSYCEETCSAIPSSR